ncbi:protein FAR1-RELATED SEQUENCE 5-like [Lotus japonicus]|uniref:protein FAR1-RELATED SEQUENCE 5-like n=1 Tax=Lotus japonicus TaxID=34305 RepID=UPI00259118FE|nr:protein FAR1-RELATED SEQUENCE 5-like [Lotus japonicus]
MTSDSLECRAKRIEGSNQVVEQNREQGGTGVRSGDESVSCEDGSGEESESAEDWSGEESESAENGSGKHSDSGDGGSGDYSDSRQDGSVEESDSGEGGSGFESGQQEKGYGEESGEEENGSGEESGEEEIGSDEESGEEEHGTAQEEEDAPGNVHGQHSEQNDEIAINGLEDMGSVNFKELKVNEVLRYHFPNREIGFLFYTWYARMHGFAARKSRTFKNTKGDVLQQSFVCFREGRRKEWSGDGLKRKRFPRKETRCGCKAYLQLHIDMEDKRWYVRSILDVHNHVLVDVSMVGLVPCHRRMNEGDIFQMNNMTKVGVNTPLAYGVFASQMGGYEKVPFSKNNMYFEQDKQRKKDVVDARGVLGYLRSLKVSDPKLFWRHTTDEDGRLDKLFWCDGCSMANYSIFGDVLAFDATYKKNKYRRPLVIFSGVNHHNQTIVFASALVSNEKEETYVWLLEQFMTAMNGKAPISVITDGHVPMKNAIQKVFPRAHHRLCAWHLLRNANSNVSDPNFISKLTKCMLWDFEIGEFEEKWSEMVVECGVEDNEWVIDLYERKKMWCAAHMRGEFFAGFRTTSRVEGLHAQVGKFVNSWNNLTDFMHNFNRYLSYQRFRELEADFASLHGDHVPQTQLKKLEMSASNYYTNNIFKWTKFAKESIAAFGSQPRPWDPMMLCRFSALTVSCKRMSKLACITPEAFGETNAMVLAHYRKLESNDATWSNVNIVNEENEEHEGERYLQNPPLPNMLGNRASASNGRGRGRRSNRCGICGVAEHNRTSCTRHTQ